MARKVHVNRFLKRSPQMCDQKEDVSRKTENLRYPFVWKAVFGDHAVHTSVNIPENVDRTVHIISPLH